LSDNRHAKLEVHQCAQFIDFCHAFQSAHYHGAYFLLFPVNNISHPTLSFTWAHCLSAPLFLPPVFQFQ